MLGNLFNSGKKQQDAPVQNPVQAPMQMHVQNQTGVFPQQGQPFSNVQGGQFVQMPQVVQPQIPQQQAPQQVVGSQMQPGVREDLSVLSHLDARTAAILTHAQEETKRIQQAMIEPLQVLFGLLYDEEIFKVLSGFSANVGKLSAEIQSKEPVGTFAGQPTLSDATKQLFEQAYNGAKNRGVDFVAPEDLLLVIFANASTSEFLSAQGIKKENVQQKLEKSKEFMTGGKSILAKYGVDLTEQAKNGELDPVTGRDKEIERIIHILLRRTKNNPVVIGEAGVGKTAIIEGLAQKIAGGTAPKELLDKKIIQLDIASLIAGASHRGEFEERLRNVIREVQASGGTIILFVDEIHTLMGAGENEGALDASNIIKPFLARGQIQIIGSTTKAEYRKYIEKDKAFERRFQPVLVDEPDEDVAVAMMKVLQPKYEKYHKVTFDEQAIQDAVHLSKRYVGQRYLPDKGVDLLDEAAAEVKLEISSGRRKDNVVHSTDIQKVVSSWTGIPITKLTENESEKLLHLEDFIHKRLINQNEAVTAVAQAVRRGRIGLSAANRPIASFIFLGPTGTGKTELAKALAELLFGKEDATIRLDMSEYMEKHEVAKLIGAPPGYVGYEEGGQLTEAVRAKPYSIVLLDEIEKAHPDVFNILLQLLEDGRLTDNKGNTVSFKNTIIIATSNIGSSLIQQQQMDEQKKAKETPPNVTKEDAAKAKSPDELHGFKGLKETLVAELRKFFKPELLNRFDDIVVFQPLTEANMAQIAKLNIEKTRKTLSEQKLDLAITDTALDQLAKEGYDPLYGARPLRRLIQTAIENPIAVLIINKTFVAGDTILIDYNAQTTAFVFTKAAPKPGTGVQNPAPGQTNAAVSGQTPGSVANPQQTQPIVPPPAGQGMAMPPPQVQQNAQATPPGGNGIMQAQS